MTYTRQDVLTAITEAVVKFPDRVNPQNDDESCVYTSEHDPSRHCIAGQVLADFGLPLPEVGSPMQEESIGALIEADGTLSAAFTDEAVALLRDAQNVFDNVRIGTGDLIDEYAAGPLQWRVAYDRLLTRLEERYE